MRRYDVINEETIERARNMAERGTVGKIGGYVTVRVSSKVVVKDEVYLGYLLLNKYLRRLFERVIKREFEGFHVYSDLENFYYLCPYSEQLKKLPEYAKKQFRADLPLILFGDKRDTEDIEVYGSFKSLITLGRVPNYDVFPLHIIPKEHKQDLKARLKIFLNDLRGQEDFPNFIGCLSYFFSAPTTPPFGKEMQSPAWFLLRFYYDRIKNENKKEELKRILQHCGLTKSEIDDMPHNAKKLKEKLREELRRLSRGTMNSMMGFFLEDIWGGLDFSYQSWKFAELSNFNEIIDSCTITSPYFTISKPNRREGCSICGLGNPTIADTNVMFGLGKKRFCKLHEKGTTKLERRGDYYGLACVKCGTASYLMLKLIGCDWFPVGRGKPLPSRFMVILHVGRHIEEDVENLNKLFGVIYEKTKRKEEIMPEDIKRLIKFKEERVPWIINNALIIREMLEEDEWRCISLYMGKEYGIFAFLLPKVRIERKRDLEFYQKRFDDSRVTILSTIGFLSELCGCDGDYYYMCLPTKISMNKTIHILGYACSTDEATEYYNVLVRFVWQHYRGEELDRKFLLAERYAKDPIIEFTHFLREWKQKKRYYNLKQDFKYDFNAIKRLLGGD